jgi:hypothetical protein
VPCYRDGFTFYILLVSIECVVFECALAEVLYALQLVLKSGYICIIRLLPCVHMIFNLGFLVVALCDNPIIM